MEFEEVAEAVFNRFSRSVYRILRKKVDDETARDLRQEVFLKLVRYKRDRLLNLNPKHDTRKETLEQLKAIVYGAVKDVYSDYYRQLTRREEKAAEYRQRDPAPAEPLDPTDGIEVREIKTKLLEALSLLSTNCRELLYLHYLKDLQYHEIAQATETLLATVKTRVYRCKAELRRIVEERYPELVPD